MSPTTPPPPPNPSTAPATLGILPQDKLIYKGSRIDLVVRPMTTTSGKTQQREVAVHPGAVIILPLLDDGRIVLIRNQRHTVNQELLELPAGTLEPPEDPAVCAARELTEETGYTAGSITPFGWFYTSPGILTEKMYVFIATQLTLGQQDLEDNEQILPYPVTQSDALSLIRQNLIVDAKSIATLLKYVVAFGSRA
jgi:ADP-ribose pyrophosphatase